jgi:hypothetical protein
LGAFPTPRRESSLWLTKKKFHSFTQAANEAAISRLYGGIHYRDAIENGKIMGTNVGNNVVAKNQT